MKIAKTLDFVGNGPKLGFAVDATQPVRMHTCMYAIMIKVLMSTWRNHVWTAGNSSSNGFVLCSGAFFLIRKWPPFLELRPMNSELDHFAHRVPLPAALKCKTSTINNENFRHST